MSSRIPVSIVTGFLGAGKTTFLNSLLAAGVLDRAALVINEFGEIGIDHLLVETSDEGIVELSGGCLCCSLRGDLTDTLERLARRDPPPERIVIETTGLADPGPIAQCVIACAGSGMPLRLAAILALLDSADGPSLLGRYEDARRQIAFSDRVVLTKSDIKNRASNLEEAVRAINPTVLIFDRARDGVKESWLDSDGLHGDATAFATHGRRNMPGHGQSAAHHGPQEVVSVVLTGGGALPVSSLDLLLGDVLRLCGDGLLRVKGLVRLAERETEPVLVQGVGRSFEPPRRLPRWPDDNEMTRLVIIGTGLDENRLNQLFDAITGTPKTDTPDRQALEQNPLALPGGF